MLKSGVSTSVVTMLSLDSGEDEVKFCGSVSELETLISSIISLCFLFLGRFVRAIVSPCCEDSWEVLIFSVRPDELGDECWSGREEQQHA